jgi:LmbE family N-acetylglucosaminyl deacetylase
MIVIILWLLMLPLQAQHRTILAVGAHAGDMELTAGAVLIHQKKLGDKIVLLHLTLGEGGHLKLSPKEYGEQKHREALAAAKALSADVLFGPYKDGELPNDEAARRYVAGIIRQVKPTHIITHWKNGIHKDHRNTSAVVTDAVLLAELEGVDTGQPVYRGVRGVYYAENWEDADGFQPYLYVNISEELDQWKQSVRNYEFVRGEISSFPYLDYYEALARVRGAEARRRYAVSFDLDPSSKKVIGDSLP